MEVGEVIGGEHGLEAVLRERAAEVHHPCVVDQDVDLRVRREDLRRHATYVALRRQVGEVQDDVAVAGARGDLRDGVLATPAVAAHERQARSEPGQRDGRLPPDAGRRTGEHAGLARHPGVRRAASSAFRACTTTGISSRRARVDGCHGPC